MIKAVYFDMGGVLLGVASDYSRTELLRYSIRTRTVRSYLTEAFDFEVFQQFVSMSIEQGCHRVNAMDQGDSWQSLITTLWSFTQREPPFRVVHQMYWDQIAYLRRHLFVYPEVKSILTNLRSAGYRIGLISNVFHPSIIYKEIFSKYKILEFFDPLVFSSDLRFKKPDRRIFEYAMSKHTDILPQESVFVGDTYDIDMLGALTAHMIPIWLNSKAQGSNYHDVIEITSLNELPIVLKKLNQ